MQTVKIPRVAVALAVLGLVVLSVLVVAQGITLLTQNWRLAWEVFPNWISAFGGVATIGALIVAWMLYRHDVDKRLADDDYRADSELRRQADLVTAWFIHYGRAQFAPVVTLDITGTTVDTIFRDTGAPRQLVSHFQFGLINASQVVIYDLVVATICEPRQSPLLIATTQPTDVGKPEWVEDRDRVVLGRANVLPPGHRSALLQLPTTLVGPKQLHLFFRDHQGVYWWRDDKGALRKQSGPAIGSDGHGSVSSRYEQITAALGHAANASQAQYLTLKPLTDDKAI